MRARLCTAAVACIARFGLAKTTLEDVAAEARVSRQTIYRYFANRDELLLEAMLQELARTAGPDPSDAMVAGVATPADAVEVLIEGVLFQLESIRVNPTLSALVATESESVRATIEGASRLLFQHYAADLRPWLELGQGTGYLNPDLDPDELSEWVLRVSLSLFFTEGPVARDADELRTYLKTYLVPVLAGPGPPASEGSGR
jgi:AcrR family transcriptional regulator